MAELHSDDQELVRTARQAASHSYSPYSGFRVGSAVRLVSGEVVVGTNFENASYSLSICAERSAMFAANSQSVISEVRTIAVTGESGEIGRPQAGSPVTPCGACRQVFAGVEHISGARLRLIMDAFDDGNILVVEGMGRLLPLSFRLD